jgi:hypothetical protein
VDRVVRAGRPPLGGTNEAQPQFGMPPGQLPRSYLPGNRRSDRYETRVFRKERDETGRGDTGRMARAVSPLSYQPSLVTGE